MARFHGDLPKRTYRFASQIIRLCQQLPQNNVGWVLGKQLLKSGTAIGANIREADAALTNREFIQFCNIARRETLETEYWLLLCQDHQLIDAIDSSRLIQEVTELAKILATIIQKSRSKQTNDSSA